jgi:hypothetical protein
MDAKQRLAAMGKDAFLIDMEERRIAAYSKGRARQEALMKDTEEAERLTLGQDTALFAGTLNQPPTTMGPGMEVGSLPEAECLTFRNHSGGDTLDAFAPLAQYTQRVHGGMTKDAWMKLSSTITNPNATVLHRVKVKEEDYVPEWAGLMTVKTDDPLG